MINCLFCNGKSIRYNSSCIYYTCQSIECKSWISVFIDDEVILTSYLFGNNWYLFSLSTTNSFDISFVKNSIPEGIKDLFILDKIDKESVLNKLDYLKYLS